MPSNCSNFDSSFESCYQLSELESEALNLGFSMSWPTKNIFIQKEKAEAEAVASRLKYQNSKVMNDDLLHDLRSIFKTYFSKNRKSTKELSLRMKVLRRLAKNEKLYIAKFDKGSGIVIEDKQNFIKKMLEILSDKRRFQQYVPCKRSQKNPHILEEDRFNRKLTSLKQRNLISEEIFKRVKGRGSQPARLYGLPKIHKSKNDPPYRPILNMRNSYSSQLATWLDSVLKDLIPKKLQT